MVAVFLLSTQAPLCSCRRDTTSPSQTTTALCQSPQSRRLLLCRAAAYTSSDVPLLSFFKHPVSRALARIFRRPVARYPSLRHLELNHCSLRASPAAHHVHAMCVVHNAFQLFPNPEILSLTYSLTNQGPNSPGESLAARDLTKTDHAGGDLFPSGLPAHAQLSLLPVFQGSTMRSPSAWRCTATASSPCMSHSSALRSISPPSPDSSASSSPHSPPDADRSGGPVSRWADFKPALVKLTRNS